MSVMKWLRGARRAQPDVEQTVGETVVEGDERRPMDSADEDHAGESGHTETAGEDLEARAVPEAVRGERGIPSVNRERSIHARVTNALAIGVMVILGLGFLSWYYSAAFKRRADEDQRVRSAAAAKAGGEMKLPPLAPIDSPYARLNAQASAAKDALAGRALGPAPDLPQQAGMVTARGGRGSGVALQPVGFVQPNGPSGTLQPTIQPQLSPEDIATLRLLNSPVLYRSAAVGGVALGAAMPAVLSQGTDSQLPVSAPGSFSGAAPSSGGGGSPSLGGLLHATPTPAVLAHLLPTRRLLLPKGAFIDCTLETALDSQLPGMTTCITATDIFGADGQVVLLDRGSKLVGETQGEPHLGQNRVFVLWTEARTPQGVVVQLASPGTDELGRSGLPGYVDNHFWQRFGAAILISVIDGAFQYAIAAQSKASGGSAVVYNTQGSRDVLTEVLRSTINIPPTVVKNQGERIQVFVARDLDFRPVYALRSPAAQ